MSKILKQQGLFRAWQSTLSQNYALSRNPERYASIATQRLRLRRGTRQPPFVTLENQLPLYC